MRLIDRDAFLDWIYALPQARMRTPWSDISIIIQRLQTWPTVDAEQVVHGHWINHFDDLFPEDSMIECSECHEFTNILPDDNYCPNCGAKMDGGKVDG